MAQRDLSATTVRSVTRALDLLDLLASSDAGMGISELSEGARLNASTVHRLLATLKARGFVRQDTASKKYLLGPQSIHLGAAARSHFDIRKEANGPLRELAENVQESTNLALLTGNEATYVAQMPANRAVQMFTRMGVRVPLHCTGVGKAMLAHLPDSEARQILEDEPLQAFTANTITNRLKLHQELEGIRQRGFAVDNEEREIGVRCVASPIFDAGDEVLAAVSISGPSGRITLDRVEELSEFVRKAAAQISARLGHRPVSVRFPTGAA